MAKRILVVEDAPATQTLLCEVLEGEGYEVLVTADGPTGLAALAEQPPDLAILDVILPRMNGLQVLQKLRRRRETARIPVVVLTSVVLHPSVFESWMCNADFYMTKPFEVADLLAVVARLLAQNGAERAGPEQVPMARPR